MDLSKLAEKLLEWERVDAVKKNLETEITLAVLELKSTQKVGNVEASYSAGRREFDYETPGKQAPEEIIKANTKTEETIDWVAVASIIDKEIIEECTHKTDVVNWNAVCKKAKINPDVVKEGTPSVSIKICKG